MAQKSTKKIKVYLEVGKKRVFASALDWPGWCRGGRDEASALQVLLDYGPRYARILSSARLGFESPKDVSAFAVTERVKGNAATDFGAANVIPASDTEPLDENELHRLQAILKACWRALDTTLEKAKGKTLRVGPRGGGRTLDGIAAHIFEPESGGYLSKLGGKAPQSGSLQATRDVILKTLEASAHGEIDEYGPRGGKRWPPRYYIRRDAWHILDHLWEIEDRLL